MKTVQLIVNFLVMVILGRPSHEASLIQDVDNYAADAFSNGAKQTGYRPDKRGLDSYRFFGFGLGKRGQPSAAISAYPDGQISAPNTDQYPRSLYESLYQRERLNRAIKALLLATKGGVNFDAEMDKRMPEVYEEKFYPMQAGKQQMEVTIDSSLQNATYTYYPGSDSIARETDVEPYSGSMDQSPPYVMGSQPLGVSVPRAVSKRWWAASRLSSFRTPKSARAYRRRWGKAHIDPALYFMGLGR